MNKYILIFLLISYQSLHAQSNSYTYVKIGECMVNAEKAETFFSVSAARRFSHKKNGIEIALLYGSGKNCSCYSAPRLLYLFNSNSPKAKTVYWGGGMSWGKTIYKHPSTKLIHDRGPVHGYPTRFRREKDPGVQFEGIKGELALGYTPYKKKRKRCFIELNISQPLLNTATLTRQTSSPEISCWCGIGF